MSIRRHPLSVFRLKRKFFLIEIVILFDLQTKELTESESNRNLMDLFLHYFSFDLHFYVLKLIVDYSNWDNIHIDRPNFVGAVDNRLKVIHVQMIPCRIWRKRNPICLKRKKLFRFFFLNFRWKIRNRDWCDDAFDYFLPAIRYEQDRIDWDVLLIHLKNQRKISLAVRIFFYQKSSGTHFSEHLYRMNNSVW